jgi:hypothetical protein
MFESTKSEAEFALEHMRKEIIGKVAVAYNNPMAEQRLTELAKRLVELNSIFLERKTEIPEEEEEKDKILTEILKSSVRTDNLNEYKEMLLYIARKCGFSLKWVDETFNEEKTFSEKLNQWVGFILVFLKNEKGNFTAVQPMHTTNSNPENQ